MWAFRWCCRSPAKGLRVNVNDLNLDNLAALKSGRLPFIEYGAGELLTDALRAQRLSFTSKPGEISGSGPVIVTIGTPVDEFLNPDRQIVQDCIDTLLPYLGDGQLLVLRSTLYPGTTDWIGTHLRRRNRDLKVAFCPERIVQGYGVEELARMPQIISGLTPEAVAEASALFGAVAPEIVTLIGSRPSSKIVRQRLSLYRICGDQSVLPDRKIGGARLPAYSAGDEAQLSSRQKTFHDPATRLGPCLMEDTMQLAAFARNEFSLGNAAMLVNEGMPLQVVADLRNRYDLGKMTVGLLGMAFKSEIDYIRASLSYKFKKVLNAYAHEVLTTDPFVTADPDLLPFDEVVERATC